MTEEIRPRCSWSLGSKVLRDYHDVVWGIPVHEDPALYAKLILDGAQAGLSWSTILNKKSGYYRAFEGLLPSKVAQYGPKEEERLLVDSGIVRNRLKIRSAIANAKAVLRIQEEAGSFDHYLWSFVDHQPIINVWNSRHEVPAQTPLSQKLSRDLKKRGFNFVGPTIIYAYMQAIGMVNDHLTTCFRHPDFTPSTNPT